VAFIRNLVPILALALLGATYSTVVASTLMFGFTRFMYPSFSAIHCLLFGSIISSTDPVSVLGMVRYVFLECCTYSQLPPTVDRNLYMMIFGESALNDAVSIILYRFFSSLAADPEYATSGVSPRLLAQSFATSIFIFIGSSVVGVGTALVFAKITKHIKAPEAPSTYRFSVAFINASL
jgi:sodium/hydrogen exchanger 8